MKILTKFVVTVVACSLTTGIIVRGAGKPDSDQASTDSNWSELIASMEKMHMESVKKSGVGITHT
jgi:hypothetical protein